MNKFLLVPIHLDALHLKNGQSVAEAMVEFNRLPYFSGERDVNPDIVNLSESIVTQPFQNKNLYLKAGIHLHWALPDALTKESTDDGFPSVPNRWLVTRYHGENTKHWMVESDYLYPLKAGFQEDSITYPYQTEHDKNSPPFRYMGRKMTLDECLNSSETDSKYLDRLTAIGYGEPTFAAFYPNCRSVFGFHDPEMTEQIPDNLEYDVIGWCSNPEQDYLRELLNTLKEKDQELAPEDFIKIIEEELKWKFKINYTTDQDSQEDRKNFINAVKEAFNWTDDNFNKDSKTPQILCYSHLIFNPSNSQGTIQEKANIKLTVANTGTEALSAYLAEILDKTKKEMIEEQLEALQFAESLDSQQLDKGIKFQEIRHEAGFDAVSGGFLWQIRLETKSSNSDNKTSQTKLNLPSEIASLLTKVNEKQQEYDHELAKINSRRGQLFSDWYKYMVSTYPPEDSWDNYPDIDEVLFYVVQQGLIPLQNKIDEVGELNFFQDDTGKISHVSGSNSSLASELANLINDLINSINNYSQRLLNEYNKLDEEKKKDTVEPSVYYLERVISPRYWQPKEPVVLMLGDDVKASQRHGEDGLLECDLLETNQTIQQFKKVEDFQVIFKKIKEIESNGMDNIGFSHWNQQPWNPFLLQWLIELFPVDEGSNKTSPNRHYSDDFLTQNYTLETNDVDLLPNPKQVLMYDTSENRIKTDSDSNIYSGFSILTPYANSLLQKRIEEYLTKHDILESYYKEKAIEKNKQKIDFLPEQIQEIESWYKNKDYQDPIYSAIKAYIILQNCNCLSQSLGGFNEALLMHKQTLQLAIKDPIGFEDYQQLTDEIAEAVGDEIKSAPQPLDDFSPIRSGEMRIIELQLIDTFGQIINLEWDEYVIKPESMKAQQDNKIVLSPRFIQPCRINFRWLSANHSDNCETNCHPDSSPICGWILPNNLNNSLMIYDHHGKALGSININSEWDNAPSENPLSTTQIDGKEIPLIENSYLSKMVKTLITLGRDFMNNFNLCLNNALNNIDPENFVQHESLALLMGRPIAVVRASVNLELLGLPAINQDWNIFRQEMQCNRSLEERDTDNFVDVKFPIRIGEYKQFNDGVIGYWKEDQNGDYEENIFYAQQSDSNESTYIKTQSDEESINIIQSLNSPPQILTMLVDPRCIFHATSGILPSKAITIPAEHYTEALANLKITFLTAPILTDMSQLHLPLVSEPDYNWSWSQNRKNKETQQDNWSEISTIPSIEKTTFTEYLKSKIPQANAEDYWKSLLDQKWLICNKVEIISKDKRPKLSGILEGLDGIIEEILNLGQMVSEISIEKATFTEYLKQKIPQANAKKYWKALLDQKWLINSNAQKVEIVPKDERPKLSDILQGLDDIIEEIFDLGVIVIEPVTTQAKFSAQQEIREGWLVLRKESG